MEPAAGMMRGKGARLVSGLASLALHALAAAGVLVAAGMEPPSVRRDPVRLTVVTLTPTAPPPAPPEKSEAPVRVGGEPRLAAPPEPQRLPAPVATGAPAPGAGQALPLVAAVEDRPAALPPPPVTASSTATELATYQQALWRHIAARRPRGPGLSGETTIRFRIAPTGALLSAEIATSSGSANLDRIALRGLHLASPMPAPPASLGPERLVFTVPVRFH